MFFFYNSLDEINTKEKILENNTKETILENNTRKQY